MSDETASPPDISSAAAIQGPDRHPTLEVGVMAGAAPVGVPREPDSFMTALLEGFEGASLEDSHGQEVVRLDREQLATFALAAKEAGFEVCADITAVDWFRHRRVRFELVVNLLSQQHRRRLRILVPVPADDPTVPSVVSVWPGAAFAERETYDMYGIVFAGNPDLTRILMPDEWEGFPLRKDFDTGSVPVQFKDSHKAT
ncbi:hypothetical protein BH23ACT5_BH23ACT5_18140 [soil metagenome]